MSTCNRIFERGQRSREWRCEETRLWEKGKSQTSCMVAVTGEQMARAVLEVQHHPYLRSCYFIYGMTRTGKPQVKQVGRKMLVAEPFNRAWFA